MYWILSVILTSTLSDLWNCIVWSCHGIDYVGSDFVLSRLSVGLWSEILVNILFINVSAVLYRVLVEHPGCTLTLSASIPRELTHLPELNLVHFRRRRNRLAGFGPML